jgi:hypothetical protein
MMSDRRSKTGGDEILKAARSYVFLENKNGY